MPMELISINNAMAGITVAKQAQHDCDERDDVFMPQEASEQNLDGSIILEDPRTLVNQFNLTY